MNIKTTSGILESVNYLENELYRSRLNLETAIIYLDILVENAIDEIVERPLFAFKLPDFDKYISFFKCYNLIRGLKSNTFSISDDLLGYSQDYSITDKEAIDIFKSI